jgi:hypothetical protein
VSFTDEQAEELKKLFPGTMQYQEAGVYYFLIPQLILPKGCKPERADALLCPQSRDGYPSRLFFAEKIESGRSRNWNCSSARIIERNWHAFSWKVNKPELRLAQLVLAHLGALR